jgi:RNA polymerase sigma-70 factor (ECF subfamily)
LGIEHGSFPWPLPLNFCGTVNPTPPHFVYTHVKQAAASEMIAIQMDSPDTRPKAEISDFDAVVRQYWPRIFRFVLASIRDRDAAETLTQDCFLRAYQARHQFRGDASVSTWLMQIAINLVRDFARSRRIRFWQRVKDMAVDCASLNDGLAGHGTSPEAQTVAKEQIEAVWRATGNLSERQRTVFLLRLVEDMDLLEIATVMGVSEGAVKVHLFRAVHTVRERMGGVR